MSGVGVPVCIATDHPSLAGHFPGHPIVPAAVLLDEVLYAMHAARGPAGAARRVEVVKFHRPVYPGQALQLQWQPAPGGGRAFELRAGAQLYVSGTVSAAA
ncbi:MAG TPA: hypothetical protein VHX52_04895 [Steroidobacteraceae bacterium]|nr:hypothetical protein [Steroidobacteraceae bacterium]